MESCCQRLIHLRNHFCVMLFSKRVNGMAILAMLAFLSFGCTQYLVDIERGLNPPSLAQAAPRLSQLTVTPSTLPPGGYTTVNISFRYEDWNEDIGPEKALMWRHLEVLSGNIDFSEPERELWVDIDHHGRYGFVTFQMGFHIPSYGFGEFKLSFALYDRNGNKSIPISTTLRIR